MAATCNVCYEDIASAVSCGSCEFKTCVSCAQRYLLDSTRDAADCMSCHAVWDREKLLEAFPKKWVGKEWKIRREDLLFERERGMMPATQLYLQWQETKTALREELQQVIAEEKALKVIKHERKQLDADQVHRWRYLSLRHQQLTFEVQRSHFRDPTNAATQGIPPPHTLSKLACPCPADGCLGFVAASTWQCGMCKTAVCRECHEVSKEGHTCKPESILTAQQLAKESKPCPHCAVPTFRISGCAQMWCVMCHKPWNWNTGQSEEGQTIHNPHFFEWQRRNGGAGEHREWHQDPYAFPPLYHQLNHPAPQPQRRRRVDTPVVPPELADELVTLNRRLMHLWAVERRKLTDRRFEDNMDLRVKLMRKEITDAQFKRVLQQREKKRAKFTEYAGVLTDYCARVRGLLRDMVLKDKLCNIPSVLEAAKQAWQESREHLQKVATRYDAVTPKYFEEDFWAKLAGVRRV